MKAVYKESRQSKAANAGNEYLNRAEAAAVAEANKRVKLSAEEAEEARKRIFGL